VRCELVRCRAVLATRVDALGRVTWTCPGCKRRKRGQCQTCPKPVVGKVGVAYYCAECRRLKQRESVMRWQRNHLDKVAKGMRRRRWAAQGKKMPAEPMTRSEAGKLGGKKGAAARVASLGPKRVKEIALKAVRIRWAKHWERQRKTQEPSHTSGDV
jgi:hypothetical protein